MISAAREQPALGLHPLRASGPAALSGDSPVTDAMRRAAGRARTLPRPRAPRRRLPRASAATVGALKRLCRGISAIALRMRMTACVASSELPPSAKKSSCTPARGAPSPSASRPGLASSACAARRARERARARRAGQCAASSLPLGSERQRLGVTSCPEPCIGQLGREGRPQLVGRGVGAATTYATRPARRGARARRRRAAGHPCRERRLDLGRLDPVAADLHLAVARPRNSRLPSARPARGRRCGTCRAPRRRTGRARTLRGRSAARVAARDAGPRDAQLAGGRRWRRPRCVEDVRVRVGGSGVPNGAVCAPSSPPPPAQPTSGPRTSNTPDGRFRRPIVIQHATPRARVEQTPVRTAGASASPPSTSHCRGAVRPRLGGRSSPLPARRDGSA